MDGRITLEQAKALMEAEIVPWVGVASTSEPTKSPAPTDGRWLCRGFAFELRGAMMVVKIDRRTGELPRASIGRRVP